MRATLGSLCGRFAFASLVGVPFMVCISPISGLASASPPATTPCSVEHLSVSVAPLPEADRPSKGMIIVVQHKGSGTCVVDGYPRVVVKRPGASVTAGRLATFIGGFFEKGTPPPPVVLQHHQSAHVFVEADLSGPATPGCVRERYRTVVVSLPGSAASKRLSATSWPEPAMLPRCTGIAVTPFLKGPATERS